MSRILIKQMLLASRLLLGIGISTAPIVSTYLSLHNPNFSSIDLYGIISREITCQVDGDISRKLCSRSSIGKRIRLDSIQVHTYR